MSATLDFTFRVADWVVLGGGIFTAGGLVAMLKSGLASHDRQIAELRAEVRRQNDDFEERLRPMERTLPRVEERLTQVQGSVTRMENAIMEFLRRQDR